jgi:hypothetical protein
VYCDHGIYLTGRVSCALCASGTSRASGTTRASAGTSTSAVPAGAAGPRPNDRELAELDG